MFQRISYYSNNPILIKMIELINEECDFMWIWERTWFLIFDILCALKPEIDRLDWSLALK